jgi:hypothetical protein
MAHLPNGDGDGGHGRQRAGVGYGGRCLPSLAQAARVTCHLARRAATDRWFFLTIFLEVVCFNNSLVQVVSYLKKFQQRMCSLLGRPAGGTW